jgi:uncharacterized protein (DUF1015 family)
LEAAAILNQWRSQGVLRKDRFEAFYPYFQRYSALGDNETRLQKGFMAGVYLPEGSIHTHEATMPAWVQERVRYLQAAGVQMQATHGLYEDPNFLLEHLLTSRLGFPLADVVDDEGIRHILNRMTDLQGINTLQEHLHRRTLYLADGHHRLAAHKRMLQLYEERFGAPPPKDHPLNYHMMYLTNLSSPNLTISPTHRLVQLPEGFSLDAFLEIIGRYFHYQACDQRTPLYRELKQRDYDMGIVLGGKNFLLKKRAEYDPDQAIPLDLHPSVKALDYTAVHYIILDLAIGYPFEEQAEIPGISYEKDASKVIKTAQQAPNCMGILMNELGVRQMQAVSDAGAHMPQKSTYFYPKVLPGILLSDLLNASEIGSLLP